MSRGTHQPEFRGVDGAKPRGYEGFGGVVAPRVSQSQPWWPQPVRAPNGAPNVIVVLVDDLGYSDVAPFGSEIPTPAVSELADTGYRFTNFRVTPLCAPSRAALLTGANPHRAGFGFVPHIDPGFPAWRMSIPEQLPTLAETFRENGYATFMVGKWHLTPEAKLHDGAEKSTWPLQRGFDRYFGSMEGMTTLFHPHRVVRDNSPVTEEFADDDYLTDRLTDEAINMIDTMRAGDGTKPFFLYFAHHAVHGPVQAKPADIRQFRGAYEAGWDQMRRDRFERQRNLGIVEPETELADRDVAGFDDTKAWEDLSDEQRERFARHMEVYAAAVASVDDSLARLIAHLKEIGEYDNTIIVFTSDNGGTDEGGEEGTRSYFSQFIHQVGLPEDWVTDVPRPIDELGGPRVYGHYPRGWAHVSNTPFRSYKGNVYEGGVRSPLILSWPNGLTRHGADDNGVRSDFAFITDLAPTLIELAGIERPTQLNGAATLEADGHSLVGQLDGRRSNTDRRQYLSLLGQRAYYHQQWKLVALRPAPGAPPGPPAWQLFNLIDDPTEQCDVSEFHPEVVAELAEEWRQAAWHNTVFPLPDGPEIFDTVPSTVLELEQPLTLRPGTPTLERYRSSRLIFLRSFEIHISAPQRFGEGMLVSHGDQGGGYALWIENGQLGMSYNAYGNMHRQSVTLSETATSIEARFTALPHFAWRIEITVEDKKVMQFYKVPMLLGMAPYTGISVGFDGGSPVDWELHERRGQFVYGDAPLTVRYVPGQKAEYNTEVVRAIDEVSARLLD